MECDQCGARRPRSGPCPECGAPPPGTFSSMRHWKDQARTGEGPAVGRRGGSGADWRSGGRGGSGVRRQQGGWDDDPYEDDTPPARSGGRNRRRGGSDYEEVDLGRALVPMQDQMLPMDPSMSAGMGGGLALPGLPQTDEEERALGIRRPVYIPAIGGKRKRKLGTWRVVSGVLSIMLVCLASCALAGLLGKDHFSFLFQGPLASTPTQVVVDMSKVPVTPVATYGPKNTYISHVVTATGIDSQYLPTGITSKFVKDSTVYLVMSVRGIPKGEHHTISVRWFLNGQDLQLQLSNGTSVVASGDVQVYFTLPIPQPGLGTAKIYVDASGNLDDPANPTLAATINFAVLMPTPVPTPKSGTPSGSPPGSPGATPSPTKHADVPPQIARLDPATT